MENRFLERFAKSHEAVALTAKWFASQGNYKIKIPDFTIAGSHKDWKKHTDNGDLYVNNKRIEVKGLLKEKYSFTTKHEYPYDNWIICAKHSYDRANPKPYAYIIWNFQRTHFAIVKNDTQKEWKVSTIKDPHYPNSQDFYVVDSSFVEVRAV
tara:strand:- start:135 stop:593 length:459 start_codon:yes stop_codon:yes gene_type:complete